MINPEIISLGKNFEEKEEGCLSIPGYNAKIKRPSSLKVKYTDENRKDNIIDAVHVVGKLENREPGDRGRWGPFYHQEDE